MCGRASLTKVESDLEERFEATFYTEDIARYNPIPSYNIVPTHPIPFINQEDKNHIQVGLWGWNVPMEKGSRLVINSRLEEIDQKKSFIPRLHHGRCIIPLDGYYEWVRNGKQKIPYRITLPDHELFSVAGLWREEVNAAGEFVPRLSIVTIKAQMDISFIHDRMPLILSKEEEKLWISGDFEPDWKNYYNDKNRNFALKHYRVSDRINSVTNNDITLIEEETSPIYVQKNLFE